MEYKVGDILKMIKPREEENTIAIKTKINTIILYKITNIHILSLHKGTDIRYLISLEPLNESLLPLGGLSSKIIDQYFEKPTEVELLLYGK